MELDSCNNKQGPSAPNAYIYVLFGPAGVGKSTVGRLVNERLGLSFLDFDRCVPQCLYQKLRQSEKITQAEVQEVFDRFYDGIRERVRSSCEASSSKDKTERPALVVASCGLRNPQQRQSIVQEFEKDAYIRLLWLRVEDERVRDQRLQRRELAGSDEEDTERQSEHPPERSFTTQQRRKMESDPTRRYVFPDGSEKNVIAVDASGPVEDVVNSVLRIVQQKRLS